MIGENTVSTSEAQKRAVQKWQNANTDLIRLRVPKGKKRGVSSPSGSIWSQKA